MEMKMPMASLDASMLSWTEDDIEQRLGFTGGRFTSANKLLTLLIAVILTIIWFLIIFFAVRPFPSLAYIAHMFLAHGLIPYPVVLLFFWGMTMLFIKSRKLAYQRLALDLAAVPKDASFVLDRSSAAEVIKRIRNKLVVDPQHFILLNRIDRALSNLRNIGNISEVSNLLRTQAEYDEEQVASSYKLVNGFVWAIPVLGFIGTVLGLSLAIGTFGATVQAGGDMESIRKALQGTTGGLSTAFEITFIALTGTLIMQLCSTYLQHEEATFLDECNDYCHAHVVSKLRLID